MKRNYLGDSYDAVKRLWQQTLVDSAPLYAEPRFIPLELRSDFTRLTRIPILSDQYPSVFSILNDPDTGIRLPGEINQSVALKHTSVKAILEQLRIQKPSCIITFDQSHYRHIDLTHGEQRLAKMRSLSERGAFSFYYVSHAPFLFAFPTSSAREEVRTLLLHTGIPEGRLEIYD
jgi:hypothetical protein